MTRSLSWVVWLFVLLSLNSVFASAAAQQMSPAGQVAGTVADETGALMPAASVSLDDGHGHKFSVKTDESGRFKISQIPAGDYKLTASADGFQTTARDVTVKSGPAQQFTLTLKVLIQEQMEVKSEDLGISTEPQNNVSAITLSGGRFGIAAGRSRRAAPDSSTDGWVYRLTRRRDRLC